MKTYQEFLKEHKPCFEELEIWMRKHNVTPTYTTDDDGIHLRFEGEKHDFIFWSADDIQKALEGLAE